MYTKESVLEWVEQKFSRNSILTKSNLKHHHVALILKRKKILGMAMNFVGSRGRGCGYDNRSIHAERAVVKKVGDHSKLRGAILIVIRISRDTFLPVTSKPCHSCQCHLDKCIKEYGLKKVYYSE